MITLLDHGKMLRVHSWVLPTAEAVAEWFGRTLDVSEPATDTTGAVALLRRRPSGIAGT